jgi:hypothetical protein
MAADLREEGAGTPTATGLPVARPMALWIVAALLALLTLVRLVVELRSGTRLLLEALNSGYLLTASHPTGPGSYWTHDIWRPRP